MKKYLVLLFLFCPNYLLAFESQPIKVEQLTKTSESWNGSTLPPYKQGQPEITILRITVQPNVELPWHEHPTINAGVMLKGKLTVITRKGKTIELSAGDPIVEVVDQVHRGVNNGTEPVEIIVFYAGVKETPLTIKTE